MNEQQTQRMQEIKARVEATTPGEWEQANKSVRVAGTQIDYGCYKSAPTGRDGGICNCLGGGYQDGKNHPVNIQAVKNAEFITHSKQDVLWLIEQLEAIQREQAERENPKPLTMIQLNHMLGKPVFSGFDKEWHVVERITFVDGLDIQVKFTDGEFARGTEETLMFYATEPKGEA